jgi:hypothetical protein
VLACVSRSPRTEDRLSRHLEDSTPTPTFPALFVSKKETPLVDASRFLAPFSMRRNLDSRRSQ